MTAGLIAVCIWIAVVDFRTKRIPDIASLPLIAIGLALTGYASRVPLADRLIGAGAGFLLLWGLGEGMFRLGGRDALGIGDAKLFSAAGAWLGWQGLPTVLLIASLMGLAFAALRPRSAERELAFGPWLAASLVLNWLRLVAGP
jgi:prepilin signal peptidase PulO-like enzyme (type II secretory pathway)